MPEEDNIDVKALYKEIIGKKSVSIQGNEVPLYYITIPQDIYSDRPDFSIDRAITDEFYKGGEIGDIAKKYGEGALRYKLNTLSSDIIYRGIPFENLAMVLKRGSDRNEESVDYFNTKNKKGLNPEDIIYGSEYIAKAREHSKTNPQAFLLYNEDELQRVEDEWYTYERKDKTKPWSEILKGVLIVEKL